MPCICLSSNVIPPESIEIIVAIVVCDIAFNNFPVHIEWRKSFHEPRTMEGLGQYSGRYTRGVLCGCSGWIYSTRVLPFCLNGQNYILPRNSCGAEWAYSNANRIEWSGCTDSRKLLQIIVRSAKTPMTNGEFKASFIYH